MKVEKAFDIITPPMKAFGILRPTRIQKALSPPGEPYAHMGFNLKDTYIETLNKAYCLQNEWQGCFHFWVSPLCACVCVFVCVRLCVLALLPQGSQFPLSLCISFCGLCFYNSLLWSYRRCIMWAVKIAGMYDHRT